MGSEKGGTEESKLLEGPQDVGHSTSSAGKKGLQRDFLDITNLVRSIQRAEGNPDCFRKAAGVCDQWACFWRRYCLQEEVPLPKKEMENGDKSGS
jgi:hypothetical protein